MVTDSPVIILSIETSTPACSVALHVNGSVAGVTEIFSDKTHSKHLVPTIQDLLKFTGIAFDKLSAVAVSRGPGSYTGLRIGVSTAKGICFAHDIPLIGIDTLRALAMQVVPFAGDKSDLICPMLDARRMEVYTMLLQADGTIMEPVHAEIINEGSFEKFPGEYKIIFAGPGASKCKPLLGSRANSIFIDNIEASARTIGNLAHDRFLKKEFDDTASFEPFYLKEFQTTIPKKKL